MEKKKMKNRTKFVIAAMIAIIAYTITNIVLLFYDKEVSDTLTVSWFTAWTAELALLAGIKITDKEE